MQTDYLDSPYTPGVTASFTPGRERQLTRMERALVRVAGQGRFEGRISVLQGARGVGKTSVLRAAERKANALGVTSVFVTAGAGSVLDALVARLGEIVEGDGEPNAMAFAGRLRESVSRLSIGVGPIGVEFSLDDEPGVPASTGTLVHDLKRLVARAARSTDRANRGLLLVIDEVQDMPPLEIRALATAWQELQAETQNPDEPRLPAVLFAAGLGDVHEAITQGASFGERFHFESLSNLSDEAAALAVIEPAGELGVRWSVDGLGRLLELAGGYPYFVQLYADEAWHVANRRTGDEVRSADVIEGAEIADEQVRAFYRGRWSKATEAERRLLVALAETGGDRAPRAEIAEAMGVPSSDLSVARASLVAKGILIAPRRGVLAFTAPGFGRFILDETQG